MVLDGSRTFTLLNPEWDEPHHLIYLNRKMGSLQIPIGTYHQSVSGREGRIVLNQAVRDRGFDPSKEFIPISLRDRYDLRKAKAAEPIFWIWDDGRLRRFTVDSVSSSGKKV